MPNQSGIATLEAAASATLGIKTPGPTAPSLVPWAGLRPITPNSRPVIGASPLDGLILTYIPAKRCSAGRWPAAAPRLLADLVDGKPLACPAEPFSVRRFS